MVSVRGSETYLVITYTKLSLCLTFSLIRTRVTLLDSQLLGIDMQKNKVNKWAWHKCFQFSTTFCIPLCSVSKHLLKALCIGMRPMFSLDFYAQ